jgi:hypothetical protein
MNLLQHPDLVSLAVTTGAELSFLEPKHTLKMCYVDPVDKRQCLLKDTDDLENLITERLTPEYSVHGNVYTLFFEQSDWLYLDRTDIELITNLSRIPDITVKVCIVEDEPSDEYLIAYSTKGIQNSLCNDML